MTDFTYPINTASKMAQRLFDIVSPLFPVLAIYVFVLLRVRVSVSVAVLLVNTFYAWSSKGGNPVQSAA